MKTMRENGINQILGELMNITIENIGNFVTEDEIWKYDIKGEASKENPLDKFEVLYKVKLCV